MVKFKHKGKRSKTRSKMRKSVRERGMPNVTVFLREFDQGSSVHVRIDPSVHYGMPHRRFNGKTGVVTGKQGGCFFVCIKDMDMAKSILVHPAHLIQQKNLK